MMHHVMVIILQLQILMIMDENKNIENVALICTWRIKIQGYSDANKNALAPSQHGGAKEMNINVLNVSNTSKMDSCIIAKNNWKYCVLPV